MSIAPLQLARVSNLLRTNLAEGAIGSVQQQLLDVQNQLSTGKRVNSPSDDPGDAAAIMQLQKTLEQRKTYASNITQAKSQLSEVDSTIGDLNDLLQQAQTIASANVGSDVTPDQRAGAAAVVQNLYSQAVSLGNKDFNGSYIFGGDKSSDPPFVATAGGVKFVGSSTVLQNRVDENTNLAFQVDGADLFGAVSTRVQGIADLTPQATAQTRLSDLRGFNGNGVTPGPIQIGNGSAIKLVDLSTCDTLGDVANAIDAAGLGNITAAVGPNGLTLSTSGTDNITVNDVGGGTTASDLGILRSTGSGAGVALTGANVKPLVTPLTQLADLKGGAGIDTTHGIIIKNGTVATTVDFTSPPLRSPATVEDLLNAINTCGADVQAQINAAGTGIDIVNPNQGTDMTIGENGGTTAADLGVRSFTGTTTLSELNAGKGVRTAAGPDFQVTRSDGTSFTVDIDGAATIQDVIDRINLADTANGTLPATVVATLAATGNGITLTDSAGGGSAIQVTALNFSEAPADLGLMNATTAGNTLTSADVNPVAAQGLFANLAKLRDALKNNDQAGITDAGQGLQGDQERVNRVRGETGARVQELETRANRLDEENLATTSVLSGLQDADYTKVITQFQQLQTALQATLESAGKTMNLSLMDFLG